VKTNTVVAIVGVIALCLFGLAGILFTGDTDSALQRLGLLFAMLGTGLTGLLAYLKAAEAASNTNGKLDMRIEAAVHRAQNARRRGDPPQTPDEIDGI
jgi:hypothetical protein